MVWAGAAGGLVQGAYGILPAFGAPDPSASKAMSQELLSGKSHVIRDVKIISAHLLRQLNEPQIGNAGWPTADFRPVQGGDNYGDGQHRKHHNSKYRAPPLHLELTLALRHGAAEASN